jgi:hypothetical protein
MSKDQLNQGAPDLRDDEDLILQRMQSDFLLKQQKYKRLTEGSYILQKEDARKKKGDQLKEFKQRGRVMDRVT